MELFQPSGFDYCCCTLMKNRQTAVTTRKIMHNLHFVYFKELKMNKSRKEKFRN